MDKLLQEAVRLRKLGFAVHFLQPGSKLPLSAGWSEAPVMSVDELQASYRPGYNLGFRPGKWSVVGGGEICVLDVDIRGGEPFAKEAHSAALAMLNGADFDVMTGSIVGRHKYVRFPIGQSPTSAATTLRQSDVWVHNATRRVCAPGADDAKPAWLIELLSTGKQVVMPPSIHPDTHKPYTFL